MTSPLMSAREWAFLNRHEDHALVVFAAGARILVTSWQDGEALMKTWIDASGKTLDLRGPTIDGGFIKRSACERFGRVAFVVRRRASPETSA